MKSYYKVTELRPGRYRIYDPLGVHMDLFAGKEKALLLDTGFGLADLKSVVKQITDLPLYVVNSHGHKDHACGNYQFEEPVYIHPEDMEVCRRHHSKESKRRILNYKESAVDFFTGEPVKPMLGEIDEEQYLQRPVGNLRALREGEVFDLGGIVLEVIELPGHTAGSIGLMDRGQRTLYAADAANNEVWLFLEEATPLSTYRKTLDKIWDLDFDKMVIAHFPLPLERDVIKDYMDLADHIDFERGVPFSSPLLPATDARLCVRDGYAPGEMMRPGFASIVISENKLK